MCKNMVLLCITMVHVHKKHDTCPKACYLPKTGYYHGTSPEKHIIYIVHVQKTWFYQGTCPIKQGITKILCAKYHVILWYISMKRSITMVNI